MISMTASGNWHPTVHHPWGVLFHFHFTGHCICLFSITDAGTTGHVYCCDHGRLPSAEAAISQHIQESTVIRRGRKGNKSALISCITVSLLACSDGVGIFEWAQKGWDYLLMNKLVLCLSSLCICAFLLLFFTCYKIVLESVDQIRTVASLGLEGKFLAKYEQNVTKLYRSVHLKCYYCMTHAVFTSYCML